MTNCAGRAEVSARYVGLHAEAHRPRLPRARVGRILPTMTCAVGLLCPRAVWGGGWSMWLESGCAGRRAAEMMVLTVCRFEWVRRDIAILMVALMVVMLTVMTDGGDDDGGDDGWQ